MIKSRLAPSLPARFSAARYCAISNIATMSWTSIRPRRNIRLEAIALAGLVFAALLTEPWWTLVGVCAVYLALMPLAIVRYARIRRQRMPAGARPVPADTPLGDD